jgi:ABC-type lipoprotein release transport system permease subunit
LGLLITTVLAAFIPANRASRIDPMQAIRQD